MMKNDVFAIGYDEKGREILDTTPLPRTPRIGSGSLYETILLAMRNERQREQAEEYDTMEEHFDLHDDEDDEEVPLTQYELAALEMERAMLAVDNPATENSSASPSQNGEAQPQGVSPIKPPAGEVVGNTAQTGNEPTPSASLDRHLAR